MNRNKIDKWTRVQEWNANQNSPWNVQLFSCSYSPHFHFSAHERNNKMYYGMQSKTKPMPLPMGAQKIHCYIPFTVRCHHYNEHSPITLDLIISSVILSLCILFLVGFTSLNLDLVHAIFFYHLFCRCFSLVESMLNGTVLISICKMTTTSVDEE